MSSAQLPPLLRSRLNALQAIFRRHQVTLAYLFGSQAENAARAESDVDLAVLLAPHLPRSTWFEIHLALIGDVCEVLGRNDVDLVLLNQATPLVRYQVVKHGIVLYEDPLTRPAIAFTSQTVVQYADTAHFRKLSRAYLESWSEMK